MWGPKFVGPCSVEQSEHSYIRPWESARRTAYSARDRLYTLSACAVIRPYVVYTLLFYAVNRSPACIVHGMKDKLSPLSLSLSLQRMFVCPCNVLHHVYVPNKGLFTVSASNRVQCDSSLMSKQAESQNDQSMTPSQSVKMCMPNCVRFFILSAKFNEFWIGVNLWEILGAQRSGLTTEGPKALSKARDTLSTERRRRWGLGRGGHWSCITPRKKSFNLMCKYNYVFWCIWQAEKGKFWLTVSQLIG